MEAEPEQLIDDAILRRFLSWGGRPDLAECVGHDTLSRFRRARGDVRDSLRAEDQQTTVQVLNQLLGQWPVRIGLTGDDKASWVVSVRSLDQSDVVSAWFAPVVWSLLEIVRDGRWDRFGTCDAAPCTCVYLDRTRNRGRRYCSDLCNDRASQAAMRRRRSASE